jgi:hypothetical protein
LIGGDSTALESLPLRSATVAGNDPDDAADADDASGVLIRTHVSENAPRSDTAVSIDTACETHDSAQRDNSEAPDDEDDGNAVSDAGAEAVANICGSMHRLEATLLMHPAVSADDGSLAANEANTAAKAESRCVEAEAELPILHRVSALEDALDMDAMIEADDDDADDDCDAADAIRQCANQCGSATPLLALALALVGASQSAKTDAENATSKWQRTMAR